MNFFCRRPVVDQLEHVGSQHHGPGRDREIAAHVELRHVDAGRQVRRAADVAHEPPCASDEVRSAGVDALLQHRRVRPREVRRCQRVKHIACRKPRLALGPPIEPCVGDQAVSGLARREVALHHPAQQPVLLPRPVAEPAIALARPSLRAPGRHARHLDAEPTRIGGGLSRMARQSRDRAAGCPRLDEPADAAALKHGVAEHHVEARSGGEPQTRLRGRDARLRLGGRFHAHRTNRPWTISSVGVGIKPSLLQLMPSCS